VFLFIFFSSAKLENRREEEILPRGQGWYKWVGRMWPGKGIGG
jgi:hypothetical protein